MDVVRTLIGCTKCKEREETIEELLAIIFEKNDELERAIEEISRLKKQMNIANPPNCDLVKPPHSELVQPVISELVKPLNSEVLQPVIFEQQPYSSAKIDGQNHQLSSELKRHNLGVDSGEPVVKISTGKLCPFNFPNSFL